MRREERILGKKHRKVGVVMGGQRGEESDWLLLLLLFLNDRDGIMIRLVVITRSAWCLTHMGCFCFCCLFTLLTLSSSDSE